MKELILTISELRKFDNDLNFVMNFLNRPDTHFGVFDMALRMIIGNTLRVSDDVPLNKVMETATQRYDACLNLLHDKWWDNCYAAHDSHFHRNFIDYCNCPFTSLTEIIDCVEKVIKGN